MTAGEASPREVLAALVTGLRLRLQDEARAGRTCLPRPLDVPPSPAAEAAPAPEAPPESAPDAAPAPRAASPEARVADAVKEDLAMAADRTFQDGLDFGAPDLGGGVEPAKALAKVAEEVAACTRCPELVANRNTTVPGAGNPRAPLVFIGEGPGQEEDKQGLPFVGRAGELLTKMIEAIGLTRDEVFICNIVKCRPPGNRNPMPDEAAQCRPYLMRQLEVLRPKVIVALGGVAAQNLLETKDGIGKLRGRFYPYRGATLMPTYHPAYVLRNYTKDTRQRVWDDLKKAKAALDEA